MGYLTRVMRAMGFSDSVIDVSQPLCEKELVHIPAQDSIHPSIGKHVLSIIYCITGFKLYGVIFYTNQYG